MLRPCIKLIAVCGLAIVLGACKGAPQSETGPTSGETIKLNQLGFPPGAQKMAIVPAVPASAFTVIDVDSGGVVFEGRLTEAATWPPSGEKVKIADFSALTDGGKYQVAVEGVANSDAFLIEAEVYGPLNAAAIKAYYFNRASMALSPEYAGDWARDAGHPDTQVLIHPSAASAERPENTAISASKGWYDAGDYNKYIVNSGISTYTLLAALEHFPAYYSAQNVGIPESDNSVPDLLDEILWNLEWMLKMQDPHDGGVYHKLTTKSFAGMVMPADTNEARYVVQKGTAAALNFAAVMAVASRVLADYEAQFLGRSDQMLKAAEYAWQWARQNPDLPYVQPDDISTGGYGDDEFSDEFAWAAAELYITTGDEAYYAALDPEETGNAVPSWSQSLGLAWMSLAHHRDNLTAVADKGLIADKVVSLADTILAVAQISANGVSMAPEDFVWGSNGVAMNRAMMLLQAHKLTDQRVYLNAAQSLLDYVLGRNPTDYSFVTGFGVRPPMYIHHRPSEADEVVAPVPGFLVGGPRHQQADDCAAYPSNMPAKSYLDDVCSYSTNEVTINWNAPLVYVTGALEVAYGQ
jgi:endoglucanase